MAWDKIGDSGLRGGWTWRGVAFALIILAAVVRLVYLVAFCPLDLAPDEAHYWDWSRQLDWSYYSKGPLVAFFIRGGCLLAGGLSRSLIHNEMLAVRLPALLCGSLMLLGLYVLAIQVFGREDLACAVVAAGLTVPVVAAGSSLMTIDAPYSCCWTWALVLAYEAVFRAVRWAWPALGLVIGIGILAKFTMVLFVPSLFLFLLLTPAYRALLRQPGFWCMCVLGAACCLPIVWWNVRNGWVTLKHVGGQAGVRETAGIRWLGPMLYVGVQFGLLLGFWFVAWVSAMVRYAPWRHKDSAKGFLWWMSAPMFCVFWAFSLKTAEEPNWPITAYVSGLVLTTAWIGEQVTSPWRGWRRFAWLNLGLATALGLLGIVLLHLSPWFQPVLLAVTGKATESQPMPLRRIDPTCRLRGWKALATAVDEERDKLRLEGIEPQLAASVWNVPGELGFYCQGNPVVYSLGLALGDRHSQYDFWMPNPLARPELFRGQTFVFVGELQPALLEAFEVIGTPLTVAYREGEQVVARWTILVCRGYRGFPEDNGRAGKY